MVSRGLSIWVCGVIALAAVADARQLLQTGTNSTNDVVLRWSVPENGLIEAVRLPVGGVVTFTWTALHDVWEIPSAQCPSSFSNSSTITQIAARRTGGSVRVTFPDEKVRYFACSVSDHCEEGQLVAIRVGNARAASPGQAPSPSRAKSPGASSGYGGNSSPGYAGGSSSNYGSGSNSSSGGYSGNSSPGYAGGSSSNYASGTGK